MPISLNGSLARLEGHVEIAEAEALHAFLADQSDPVVDVTECLSAHTAVAQLIVLHAPALEGAIGSRDWRELLVSPHVFMPAEETA